MPIHVSYLAQSGWEADREAQSRPSQGLGMKLHAQLEPRLARPRSGNEGTGPLSKHQKAGEKGRIGPDVQSADEPLYKVEWKQQYIQLEAGHALVLGKLISLQVFLEWEGVGLYLNVLEFSPVVKGSLKYFILNTQYYFRKTS